MPLVAATPTTLTDVGTLLDALALPTGGVGIREALALVGLGERRCLVCAGDVVTDVLLGLLTWLLGYDWYWVKGSRTYTIRNTVGDVLASLNRAVV